MKKIVTAVFLTCLMLFSLPLLAAQTGSIEVSVEGVRNGNGIVEVALFNSEEGYPDKSQKALQLIRSTIKNGKAVVVFQSIPYGHYAISAMHDEDNDGKMKVNFMGIPKEGTAASNNAKGSFGPPDFKDARFEVSSSKMEISLEMQY
ncbi:MAG: DUF2141 domain-containing protein [Candidatus Thiodiazotropha sp.]